jgi:hypothetical protein
VVEVFKTNIQKQKLAREVANQLLSQFPEYRINFDLQDCDNILRVEGAGIPIQKIVDVVTEQGFFCEVLQ